MPMAHPGPADNSLMPVTQRPSPAVAPIVSRGAPDEALQLCAFDDQLHRQQVIALWREVFGYEAAHNTPALAIDKKLAVADGLFFVALRGGAVVGTTLAGYDGHRGWLYSVAVYPLQRQRGVGSALVAHAERALVARGCLKINLQIVATNESIARFYQSLGYAVEPRISMGKVVHGYATSVPQGTLGLN